MYCLLVEWQWQRVLRRSSGKCKFPAQPLSGLQQLAAPIPTCPPPLPTQLLPLSSVTKQSVWVRPVEMGPDPNAAPAAAPVAAPTAGAAAAAANPAAAAAQVVKLSDSKAAGGAGPAAWLQAGPTPHYATTSEAKDAFKGLLLDAGVSSGMSWEESMRLIVQDRRCGRSMRVCGCVDRVVGASHGMSCEESMRLILQHTR